MLTTKQTCELLNISRPTLYKLIENEKIVAQPTKTKGRSLEFFEDSVESVLDYYIREKEKELNKLKQNQERLKHHIQAWGD